MQTLKLQDILVQKFLEIQYIEYRIILSSAACIIINTDLLYIELHPLANMFHV